MSKTLSIVCARAGSKGLENKCSARIKGRMVAEYAIEHSLSLGSSVTTVVSTDIPALLEYCDTNEIISINRDKEYCADASRIDDALADVIERYGQDSDYCSLVYGNIPLRYSSLFEQAVSFLDTNHEFDAVASMQNVEKFHPDWMLDLCEDELPRQKFSYQRQQLPQKMVPDGHTLVFKSQPFLERYKGTRPYKNEYLYAIFGERIKPLLNTELIIDIDTARDLKLVTALMEQA